MSGIFATDMTGMLHSMQWEGFEEIVGKREREERSESIYCTQKYRYIDGVLIK